MKKIFAREWDIVTGIVWETQSSLDIPCNSLFLTNGSYLFHEIWLRLRLNPIQTNCYTRIKMLSSYYVRQRINQNKLNLLTNVKKKIYSKVRCCQCNCARLSWVYTSHGIVLFFANGSHLFHEFWTCYDVIWYLILELCKT